LQQLGLRLIPLEDTETLKDRLAKYSNNTPNGENSERPLTDYSLFYICLKIRKGTEHLMDATR